MKELAKVFSSRYNAVSTKSDDANQSISYQQRKSLRASRTLNQGLNIVDSFFNKRKAGSRTRVPKCSFLLMAGGILAITFGFIFKALQPYDLIFRWKLIFEDEGEIFGLWEKPPIDLYVKIYLFNITNPEEYLAKKEKMKVEEVGPYVYKEVLVHDDVVFNENGTLSTIPRHPLIWQEHLSGGREDDEVMMLNIALLSIAQVAADKSFFFRVPINMLIKQTKSQPIVKMTAKEFMFGYETPLTTLGNTFLPDWISFEKVGLIDRMYDFSSDFETFFDGTTDPSISGLYDTYRGSPNLPQWDDEHCSNIQYASDGTKFKSFLEPNETVKFFRKSMCRPQRMVRVGEEQIISEMKAFKYVFEENALDNGYYDQRNKCYCRKGYCQPRGLIDVTDCYYGFPISLSYPHFMGADPKVIEAIDGMKPNESQHDSYFMLNPKSGLPISCSVKFQINMHIRDVSSMNNVGRFSDTTFPMLWFEITMHELPEPLKNRFNLYLNVLPYVDVVGFWGGITIGIACLLFAVTRATLKLPQFLSTTADKYEKKTQKYTAGKQLSANIRPGGVYQPCEMKLDEVDEKLHNCVLRSSEDEEAALYDVTVKIDDNDNNKHSYALEQEPAISDDEESGNLSDCSQHTTSSSQCISSTGDELDKDNEHTKITVPDQNSYDNQGFESSKSNAIGWIVTEKPQSSPSSSSSKTITTVTTNPTINQNFIGWKVDKTPLLTNKDEKNQSHYKNDSSIV